jgi:hypothetical protein
MSISYTISVYNESLEINKLLSFLSQEIAPEDEIVVVHTYRNPEEQHEKWFLDIQNICKKYSHKYTNFHFQNNFGAMKNYLSSLASKDFITNFDADEIANRDTIHMWKDIVENHPFDLYLIPRINIVDNYTIEDVNKYGWSINENGWINWPDYQPRIYKNYCGIEWVGDVHEQLKNYKQAVALPSQPNLSIIHHKTIEKQRKQNSLYDSIS